MQLPVEFWFGCDVVQHDNLLAENWFIEHFGQARHGPVPFPPDSARQWVRVVSERDAACKAAPEAAFRFTVRTPCQPAFPPRPQINAPVFVRDPYVFYHPQSVDKYVDISRNTSDGILLTAAMQWLIGCGLLC